MPKQQERQPAVTLQQSTVTVTMVASHSHHPMASGGIGTTMSSLTLLLVMQHLCMSASRHAVALESASMPNPCSTRWQQVIALPSGEHRGVVAVVVVAQGNALPPRCCSRVWGRLPHCRWSFLSTQHNVAPHGSRCQPGGCASGMSQWHCRCGVPLKATVTEIMALLLLLRLLPLTEHLEHPC